MKTFKAKLTAIGLTAVLLTAATGMAQTNSRDFSDYIPKSPEKAARYSTFGTLLPIMAGIAWWKLDKPGTKTQKEYYNGRTYTFDIYEDPDRTIPATLILSGIFLGPSAGYFYGGCPERGVRGILLRTATGALTIILASSAANSAESDQPMDFSGMAAGVAVGGIGSLVILVEVLYDLGKVRSVVAESNTKKAEHRGANISVLPIYFADSGAGGLELNITF